MNKNITQGSVTINGEVVSGFNSAQICDNDGSIIPVGFMSGSGEVVSLLKEGESVMTEKQQEAISFNVDNGKSISGYNFLYNDDLGSNDLNDTKEISMTMTGTITEEGKAFFEDIGKDLEETERKYEELSQCFNQLGDIYNGIVHELKKLNVDKAKNSTLMVELYKRLTILENWMKIIKIKMNSLNKEVIDQE